MNRPTRRHANLRRKLSEKEARGRKSGRKQRRMRRWASAYESLAGTSAKAEAE